MRDNVIFKGNRDGLQLVIDESVDFAVILDQLKAKLASANEFFSAGAVVHAPAAEKMFTAEQRVSLTNLLAEYGLAWTDIPSDVNKLMKPAVDTKLHEQSDVPLVINKTIRGGQEITYKGSVVIYGDVNPGAKVVAGGNIIIYGTCRGIAHAGALGDIYATISADRIVASQLRIAAIIARAPDTIKEVQHLFREVARIRDGVVIIEPTDGLGGSAQHG